MIDAIKKHGFALLLVLSLCSMVATTCQANPLHEQLLADAADGSLDSHPLLEATLIAGGIDQPADLIRCRTCWERHCQEMARQLNRAMSTEEQAEQLLVNLHRRVLTGQYIADCGQIEAALEQGNYNCVSATALYVDLAHRFDLPVTAAASRGHVNCRLELEPSAVQPLPMETLPIETTCNRWIGRTNTSQPAAQTQVHSRKITDVELLGKIYYNRGIDSLARQEFENALELFAIAWQLDTNDLAARENLLATYNNGALALTEAGQHEQAVRWLLIGLNLDPQNVPLLANDLHIHQRWVNWLASRGQLELAKEVTRRARERRPQEPYFQELENSLNALATP